MSHTFETPEPVTVRVVDPSGYVAVDTRGGTTSTVTLAPVTDSDADRAATDDTSVRLDGDVLSVEVPRRRGLLGRTPQVGVTVSVPTGSSARIETGSADVTLDGDLAEAEVKSGSGDVTTRGSIRDARLSTGSGDVTIEEVGVALRVSTGSGTVSARSVTGRSSISSGSGDVGVDLGTGELVTKSGSGDVVVRRHRGTLQAKSGSGDLRVDAISGGAVTASSGSGDVTVGIADQAPVWLDLTTVTGEVRNDLDASEPPEGEADQALAVELHARTATGDITVRRA